MNYSSELDGKIALVNGGTKGAGKAIAERLVKAGATVIITARNAPETENNMHFISADLSKADDAQKVIGQVLFTHGRLDILINNLGASSTLAGGFSALNDEDWILALKYELGRKSTKVEFLNKKSELIDCFGFTPAPPG